MTIPDYDTIISFILRAALTMTLGTIGAVSILCAFTATIHPAQNLAWEIVMRAFFFIIGSLCLWMIYPSKRK